MNRYEIRCTSAQTKKALALCAPIETSPMIDLLRNDIGKSCLLIGSNVYWFPTAEQMIGWLEEQGFTIDTEWSWSGQVTMWVWYYPEKKHIYTSLANSRKEATLAIIDAALEYLEKRKGGKE